jgi:hypothetical protein
MITAQSTSDFDLIEDEQGRLTLRRPGEDDVAKVAIRRAFPWSSPTKLISIRSTEGKELLLIDDLSQLPAALRLKIENWLARHSFVPKITRVHRIDLDFGYQQWKVETDRGPAEFRVQEREDIRFLHDGRFAIKDANGNIYELMNLAKLDAASRRVVEGLL